MAERGAPLGNDNATKNKLWADTIRKAVAQGNANKLRSIAEKLLDMAEAGDIQAMKELGDRLDGKPKQAVEASGPDGGNIIVQIVKQFDS